MINILYTDNDIVAVEKPVGVPVQKDLTNDLDLLTLTSEYLKDNGEKGELWLVHRLDRVVGGAIVFARNKKIAASLSSLIQQNAVNKYYYAVVEGATEDTEQLDNYIYKDANKSKAFIVDRERRGVKSASLIYKRLDEQESTRGTLTLLDIKLITGRFHQIRAQLSHRQNPLVGDGKYGSKDNKCTVALYSYRINFTLNKRNYDIRSAPDTSKYPWNLFEAAIK